jgi:hypothetical protein
MSAWNNCKALRRSLLRSNGGGQKCPKLQFALSFVTIIETITKTLRKIEFTRIIIAKI